MNTVRSFVRSTVFGAFLALVVFAAFGWTMWHAGYNQAMKTTGLPVTAKVVEAAHLPATVVLVKVPGGNVYHTIIKTNEIPVKDMCLYSLANTKKIIPTPTTVAKTDGGKKTRTELSKPGPKPTDTPEPKVTNTPEPKSTDTPAPKATETSKPTNTPVPTEKPSNTPVPTEKPVNPPVVDPTEKIKCDNGFGNLNDLACKTHGNAINQDEIGKHQDGKVPGGAKLLEATVTPKAKKGNK